LAKVGVVAEKNSMERKSISFTQCQPSVFRRPSVSSRPYCNSSRLLQSPAHVVG